MGRITIIGAGNGGCTYAAYLGKRGHEVCLYEVPELADNLKDIRMHLRGQQTRFMHRCRIFAMQFNSLIVKWWNIG